ncbi:MAG TPA: RnfABCDGE type electron transport complex subunit D [Proteobacteria bacterium]|nr:electron transport complex protein RnfD [bacterium BMS3Abin14]HDL52808.1 RnfABCDGE type electron transport complex subunit D [Pseudomonadota bacterium]
MTKSVLAPSPHLRSPKTIETAMYGVIVALVPAAGVGVYFFGLNAVRVIAVSIIGCLIFEGLVLRLRGKGLSTLKDGSAILTGLLLAMNLPSSSPVWMVLIGSSVAILVGKQVYGGLGYNPFNPALVARVFLLISFPVAMTSWPEPGAFSLSLDTVTKATPLGAIKTNLLLHGNVGDIAHMSLLDPFMGRMGGSLGEVSAIALLLGGIFLLARGVITWHIPGSFLATVFGMTGLFWLINPQKYASPFLHLVTGGLLLGAIFMATDYVTSPVTTSGMIMFGVGCGAITVFIRLFGGYPEGVSFAILLMNSLTPIIDRYTRPRVFGYSPAGGVKA